MSGKKQHIIPQFIQKNFSENKQLHFHSKEKCYTSAIKDIYAENCYYSEENGFLDNKITELEQTFSKTFNSLFSLNNHVDFDMDEELNKLLSHLFFRNKFILNILKDLILSNISIIIAKWKTKAIEHFNRNKKLYKNTKINRDKIGLFISNFIKEKEKSINSFITDEIKKKFLSRSITNDAYLTINSFKYRIISGENFILPDVLVVSYSEENSFSPFIDKNTEYVLFPISNNKVLFIYKGNCVDIDTSENNINEILISASYTSFLSNIKNKKENDICKIHSSTFYIFINNICNSICNDIEESLEDQMKELTNILKNNSKANSRNKK